MTRKTKIGDTIKVHYTGYLEDKSIFDTSKGKDTPPFEFKIGGSDIIPGFETACIDMEEGESKTISILPEEAYGHSHKELISDVDLSLVPKEIKPEIGLEVKIGPEERPTHAIITNITEKTLTLDANHPLAGKTLTFDIDLIKIV